MAFPGHEAESLLQEKRLTELRLLWGGTSAGSRPSWTGWEGGQGGSEGEAGTSLRDGLEVEKEVPDRPSRSISR